MGQKSSDGTRPGGVADTSEGCAETPSWVHALCYMSSYFPHHSGVTHLDKTLSHFFPALNSKRLDPAWLESRQGDCPAPCNWWQSWTTPLSMLGLLQAIIWVVFVHWIFNDFSLKRSKLNYWFSSFLGSVTPELYSNSKYSVAMKCLEFKRYLNAFFIHVTNLTL